ncbi:MAG: site-2 protease family protein [Candidatus Aenigmarchaeota archaeon]|nr:site-2 protease family protein [Candidatus Aenigmarchaeota archaeon]
MLFSQEELKDIVISVLIVAFIFCRALTNCLDISLYALFLVFVILSFLFHELAHRFVSQKLGCSAVYKMFLPGLLLGIVFAVLFRLIIVMPGAVVIYPFKFGRWKFKVSRLTVRDMGVISFAGIAVNLFFAILFRQFPGDIFYLFSTINAWLAFFNLIPIKPLDGSKIFLWKPYFWFILIVIAGVLLFLF